MTGRVIPSISQNNFKVDLTVSGAAIQPGDHAKINVAVTSAANGSGLENIYVEITSSPSTATLNPVLARTGVVPVKGEWISGLATSDFTSNTAGTYKITAQSYSAYFGKGDSRNKADATSTTTITVGTPPSPSPSPSPSSSPSPSPSPGAGTITPKPGSPTPVAAIVTVIPPAVTPVSSSSVSSAVNTMLLIGGCIAGIVILLLILAVILLFLWLKRTLKIVPKTAKLPADGVSSTPVRVQFVNGLGMAKKVRNATEVEIDSTAGKINGATIPAGKHYVDTELVSSKEFGLVTITAKALGKSATAQVEFVAENGSIEITAQPETIPADGKSSASVTIKVKDGKGNFVAPLEDKTVDLKTTLGTLPPSLKWPARATSVSTNIVSSETSGTAVINAIIGSLRGDGKVNFEGMPKRFCMHCGTPMSLEASTCPKCSKTPPSGTDVKECPGCGTIIPEAAKFCHHCGAIQADKK